MRIAYDDYAETMFFLGKNSMRPHIHWLQVFLLLLNSIIIGAGNKEGKNPNNKNFNYKDSILYETSYESSYSIPCNSTKNLQEIKVQFSTAVVKNEYIVAFKGYYKPQTRENYIRAALNSSGIKNWKVLSRNNPASEFPSDFDVVLLEETDKQNGLDTLSDHPLVRRVTPQRLVRRTLKYDDTSEEDGDPEYKNFKRKINSYVSIAIIPNLIRF